MLLNEITKVGLITEVETQKQKPNQRLEETLTYIVFSGFNLSFQGFSLSTNSLLVKSIVCVTFIILLDISMFFIKISDSSF